jgi:HlyD family secretion protein
MNSRLFFKPANRLLVGLAIAATAITSGIIFFALSQSGMLSKSSISAELTTVPATKKVTALGRLEPQTEVIRLSAPATLDGDRVAEILVKQGDRVKKGQVVAILDSRDRLQAALAEAKEKVRSAQSRLAQVKAGAKSGEIQAQESTIVKLQAELQGEIASQEAAIARLQSELQNARSEFERNRQLYQEGAISSSAIDSKRLTLESAEAKLREASSGKSRTVNSLQAQIAEAKATLSQIAEVRPVDVQVAQADVDSAIAAVKRAETELAQAIIRVPMDVQILKIHARLGEKIGDNGIADLGQTDRMVAVAEVYQTDIGKVKLGQEATITGQAFSGEVKGTVSEIGLQVNRQNVFSDRPGENLDRRVIEVKIRLNPKDSQRVEGLTNLQVQTAIQL